MGAGPHRHARVNTHTRSGQGQPPLHSLPVAMWGGEGWAGDPPRPSPRLPPRMPTAEPLPSPRPAPPPSAPPPSARTPGSVHGGAGELLSPRVGAGAASAQLCRPPAVSLPTLRMREQFSATPAFTMPPTPGHRTPGQALPPPPERLRPQRAFTWGPRIALGLGLPFLQLHGQPKVGNADVAWRTNTAQVTYSPTNRGPGLPGAAGALASFCTHTCPHSFLCKHAHAPLGGPPGSPRLSVSCPRPRFHSASAGHLIPHSPPRPPVLPSSLFYFGVFLHLVPAHRAWLPGPGKAGTVHVSAGAVTGKRVVSLRVPACSPPIASLRRRMARSWQSVLFLETARTLVFPLEITGGTSAGSTVVPIIPPSL